MVKAVSLAYVRLPVQLPVPVPVLAVATCTLWHPMPPNLIYLLYLCHLQNFFRSYPKLAGMTGTAETESQEFQSIYRLPVTVVPPNRTVARTDQPDVVFRNEAGELEAQRHGLLAVVAASWPVPVWLFPSLRMAAMLIRIVSPLPMHAL